MMVKLSFEHKSIIRSYLRHLSRFPDRITRAYLLNVLQKRCRRPHGSDPDRLRNRIEKTKNFLENVRLKIAAANSGHVNVFEDLLRESFARTGERREKLLELFKKRTSTKELEHPSSKFPTYSPELVSLLTSPASYPLKTRPSINDLQSIPPNSLITNVWSDLPSELQSVEPPKYAHMGMLNEARQINKRKYLYEKWVDALVGPPLSIPEELKDVVPLSVVKQLREMLDELKFQAKRRNDHDRVAPAFSSLQNFEDSSSTKPKNCSRHRKIFFKDQTMVDVPAKITPSHPLYPTPLDEIRDPLIDILPKRQKPCRAIGDQPPTIDLSRGPRRTTGRFIRRRYQNVLSQVPTLVRRVKPNQGDTSSEGRKKKKSGDQKVMIYRDSDGRLVDRSWITGGNKSYYNVEREGECLGVVGNQLIDEEEDLAWMRPITTKGV